jgi:hypothetical protein
MFNFSVADGLHKVNLAYVLSAMLCFTLSQKGEYRFMTLSLFLMFVLYKFNFCMLYLLKLQQNFVLKNKTIVTQGLEPLSLWFFVRIKIFE